MDVRTTELKLKIVVLQNERKEFKKNKKNKKSVVIRKTRINSNQKKH